MAQQGRLGRRAARRGAARGQPVRAGAGNRLWPYHLHHANEEWLVVVRGEPTLRTPEGQQQLVEGDVVVFPRGNDGAHQVSNGTDTAIRVLMLSSMVKPEIVEYPDSGKVGARSAAGERILHELPRARTRLLGRRGLQLCAEVGSADSQIRLRAYTEYARVAGTAFVAELLRTRRATGRRSRR